MPFYNVKTVFYSKYEYTNITKCDFVPPKEIVPYKPHKPRFTHIERNCIYFAFDNYFQSDFVLETDSDDNPIFVHIEDFHLEEDHLEGLYYDGYVSKTGGYMEGTDNVPPITKEELQKLLILLKKKVRKIDVSELSLSDLFYCD